MTTPPETSMQPARSISDVAAFLARLVLGIMFVASGTVKALDFRSFAITINLSYGFHSWFAWPVGWAWPLGLLPASEIALGAAMLLGIALRRVAMIVVGLLVAFSLSIVYGMTKGTLEGCGCFGGLLVTSPSVSLLRNLAMGLAAGFVWAHERGSQRGLRKGLGVALSGVLLIVGTWTGYSINEPFIDQSSARVGTPLNIQLSGGAPWRPNNGRQLVFVFSPTCSHCWDAVENVNALSKASFDVVAITAGKASEVRAFRDELKAGFPILRIEEATFLGLMRKWPTLIVLENGVIKQKFEGSVPAVKRLRKELKLDAPPGPKPEK